MRDHDHTPADEDSRKNEYDELRRLIVEGQWNPGDIFRTSKGAIWQVRKAPYTAGFPGMNERHASGKASKDAFRPRTS
jgi:hypothetical protein